MLTLADGSSRQNRRNESVDSKNPAGPHPEQSGSKGQGYSAPVKRPVTRKENEDTWMEVFSLVSASDSKDSEQGNVCIICKQKGHLVIEKHFGSFVFSIDINNYNVRIEPM